MGYIAHDAVLAVGVNDHGPDLVAFRKEMPENLRHLLVGPIDGINFRQTWVFVPDGSKEGWDSSDLADEWRSKFLALVGEERSWYDVVHLRFGGDHGREVGTTVMHTTDDRVRDWSGMAG